MAGLPQEGQEFGRYEIVRRIGRGGMGVVYAAVQKGLGREVALKVLSSELAENEDYRNRFLREAEVLARLDSPHIIQVHDAGEQDGWLYIATQLVPDGDLQEALNANGALPDRLALDLTAQVADGVGVAHRAGIIHRDIKPSNVLLRRRSDESIQAYVCDLGISRVLDSQHTKTQGVIGTFAYMAPERHEGHEATIASDVYALGCLLWAAVSGEAPYKGTDGQVLMGHLNGPIPQLQRHDRVAQRINEVLLRSMAKNPNERYGSAAEFSAACTAVDVPSQADESPTRLPSDRPSGARASEMAPAPVLTPMFPPPHASGQQGFANQGTHGSGPNQYDAGAPTSGQYSSGKQQFGQQQFVSGPQGSGQQGSGQFGSGPQNSDHYVTGAPQWAPAPSQENNRAAWLVAGLAALVLVVGGVVVAVVATQDSDGRGNDKGAASEGVPTDASLDDFCEHYMTSPDRDIESVRDYAKTMEEMGTPPELPDEARDGFLWQLELVDQSDTYDEFTDGFNAMSERERTQVKSLDDWAKANCP